MKEVQEIELCKDLFLYRPVKNQKQSKGLTFSQTVISKKLRYL